MKKLLLVSLTTMLFAVTAWAADQHVSNITDLKAAIADASVETIYLDADIDYAEASCINILRSVTIDGQGHTLSGYGRRASTSSYPTIAINQGGSSMVNVKLKNLQIINPLWRVVETRGNIDSLTIDNCLIEAQRLNTGDYDQPITIGGNQASQAKITIKNSKVVAAVYYPIITFNPIKLKLENTEIEGWCSVYFKSPSSSAGSTGSVVEADGCHFDAPNVYSGETNAFGMFVCEDDGISISLNNCGMAVEQRGDQRQAVLVLSNNAPKTQRTQAVSLSISGDNTYINGALLSDCWSSGMVSKTDYSAPIPDPHPLSITISGGTYAFNPSDVWWYKNYQLEEPDKSAEANKGRIEIPSGYEIKTIETTQAGETKTLYRVRQQITGSTALNDNEGQNPTEDIKVTDDVSLTNNNTKAEYIEIQGGEGSDPVETVTVTVPKDKTLKVSNGMDVTGNAEIVAKAGSTVAVGEGGVISEKAENIVIEADANGSASFLLSPEVVVNTTPNVTVKMTAHVGKKANGDNIWHRFAMPVGDMAEAWTKSPNLGTYLYGWDYEANDWAMVAGGSTSMDPFKGYTISINETEQDVVYTFKGNLAGNTNNTISFSRRGYNFFGNSYTGYMYVLDLLNELDMDVVDGSVWMWDKNHQTYTAVPINSLREHPSRFPAWKKEVAPMQTFILRLMEGESSEGQINYADAIWGNPRYSAITRISTAPKRAQTNTTEDAFIRVKITASDGKCDMIDFTEDSNFSDAYDKGYDATKFINPNSLNIYSTINDEALEAVATNVLLGKTISMETQADIDYTLSFEIVEGTPYAIKDIQTGIVTPIAENNTYTFSAQPNATIEGRFMIVAAANVTTNISNTSVNQAANGIYTILGQYIGEISMWSTLPSGIYIVNGVKLVK